MKARDSDLIINDQIQRIGKLDPKATDYLEQIRVVLKSSPSTEKKIYQAANISRHVGEKIICGLTGRKIQAGKVKPGKLQWKSDVWCMVDGRDKRMEIKTCTSAHKNCSSPFKAALGAGVEWIAHGAEVYFLFLDLVEHAHPNEHPESIQSLTEMGIKVKVLTENPRDSEIKNLVKWFVL